MIKGIINNLLKWNLNSRIDRVDFFRKNPVEVQEKVLSELLEIASDTEWGKRYGFESIRNYSDFKNRIPLHTYEEIEPEIERLKRGEEDIMWPGEIKFFAKSSGTTNAKSKFIPVSTEALEECHFNAGRDMLSVYFEMYPDSQLFRGLSLRLGGSTEMIQGGNGSYYGDLSAILIKNFPTWVQWQSTPANEIALLGEWESKIEKIAQATINENVTSIAGVPSWMNVLANKILEITGKSNMNEVWPEMELYMHGGVNFDPNKAQFQKLFPNPNVNYLETYNASEGFFGFQDQRHSNELLLLLDYGIFYEFVPTQYLHDAAQHCIPLAEVELGVNYALVISTNSGLWRYLIGDTVVFTSKNPYRIRITGRTKHFINAFGEELIIENAERALQKASDATGAQINEYTAAPVYMANKSAGAHEWLIEFNQAPSDLNLFAEVLDETLKQLNSDYEAKRHKNMTLAPPRIHVMPEGTFYKWMKSKGKLGGQNKVPRLSNSRETLEAILELVP